MIRIHAGMYAGREITRPKSDRTRPTLEKPRAALFDRLGGADGMRVLDVYAGTGALGLEAISQGAASAVFVEQNRGAAKLIDQSAEMLGCGDQVKVMTASAKQAAKRLAGVQFDLIMADPPFANLDENEVGSLAELLNSDGILVLVRSSRLPTPVLQLVTLVDERKYGDTTLSFYRR